MVLEKRLVISHFGGHFLTCYSLNFLLIFSVFNTGCSPGIYSLIALLVFAAEICESRYGSN